MRQSRDPLSMLRALEDAPWDHDFYRTLRDVECAYPEQPRLGTALRPQDESIRLGQEPSMAFAPAVFSALRPGKNGAPPRLVQQFFGLFGPNGPLPLHLTEFARERMLHSRDGSFVRFADLLHHRSLTLFYRAWAQAQPTVSSDRPQQDAFSASSAWECRLCAIATMPATTCVSTSAGHWRARCALRKDCAPCSLAISTCPCGSSNLPDTGCACLQMI